jgi:hypothetical protein
VKILFSPIRPESRKNISLKLYQVSPAFPSDTNSIRARGGTVVKVLCYKSESALVRFQMLSLEFFTDIILPMALRPWGRPGEFPGGKCGRCVRLTNLLSPCAVVMKSGYLNFLEPSGPLQAYNGSALPFTFLRTVLRGRRTYAYGVLVDTVTGRRQNYLKKSVPLTICQGKFLHRINRKPTKVSAVEGRRLMA